MYSLLYVHEILPPFGRLDDKNGKGKKNNPCKSVKLLERSEKSVVKKNKKLMENENRTIWGKILKITITLLTALASAFGVQACV
jgi:hypothetical protein